MAISRAQLAKELEPGLNALFGMEYTRYEGQHAEIFDTESSDRAFEEEVMLSGFGAAPVKGEGTGVTFDDANEAYTARYNHETVAMAFSITEEAVEDNLYDRLASRYTRALARSMAHTKQVKAAAILNNAFTAGAFAGGDGVDMDYIGSTTDFHIGVEGAGEDTSWYLQAGPALVSPDNGEADVEFSGKIGGAVAITADKNLNLYGEVSFITVDDFNAANVGTKIGVKYLF